MINILCPFQSYRNWTFKKKFVNLYWINTYNLMQYHNYAIWTFLKLKHQSANLKLVSKTSYKRILYRCLSLKQVFVQYFPNIFTVRSWWCTELSYCETLSRPFVIGQKNRITPRQAVLPLGAEENISLIEVQHMFVGITIDGEPQKV